MGITKSTDKKTGITYVYSSESYWDKDLKAPRNRKKLIGKIDKETGEVVPTGKGEGSLKMQPVPRKERIIRHSMKKQRNSSCRKNRTSRRSGRSFRN